MAKTPENGISRRMADLYFEVTTPDGKTQVFSSTDSDEDESDEEGE